LQRSGNLTEDSLFINLQTKLDNKLKVNYCDDLCRLNFNFDCHGVEKLSVRLVELSIKFQFDLGVAN
jgi:hypothetical protein